MKTKPVPGFNGIYSINTIGHIISTKKNNNEPISSRLEGTRQYTLLYDAGTKKYSRKAVDKLVAEAFVDNPYGYKFIRHLNGDPSDCSAQNLAWVRGRRCLACPQYSEECNAFTTCLMEFADQAKRAEKQKNIKDQRKEESLSKFREAVETFGGLGQVKRSAQRIVCDLWNGTDIADIAKKHKCSVQYVYRLKKKIQNNDDSIRREY